MMIIGHTDSIEGKTRTRRIFSTLNRYAKPVGKGDIIALDEDDIVAIITRDLLEEYPLFQNKKILVSQTTFTYMSDESPLQAHLRSSPQKSLPLLQRPASWLHCHLKNNRMSHSKALH